MRKVYFVIIGLVILVAIGVIIPKSFKDKEELRYVNNSSTESPQIQCGSNIVEDNPKDVVALHLDHPIQRLLILKLVITDITDDNIEVTAYTLFGIPLSVVEYDCYGGIATAGGDTNIAFSQIAEEYVLDDRLMIFGDGQDVTGVIKEFGGTIISTHPADEVYEVKFPVRNIDELTEILEKLYQRNIRATFIDVGSPTGGNPE